MQVILKPLSHPELGEIIIDDNLFPVGRFEAPFSTFDKDVVTSLSRRHARIFEQGQSVFIADLGSRNGTRVNGKNIEQTPAGLQRGDEICLGGNLVYKVEILGLGVNTHVPPTTPSNIRLTLMPQNENGNLEPIVITRFPFLIGKSEQAFSRYKQDFPEEVNYISRRHSHVFLKGEDLYVEDLGSTNGSYINDTRLDEHAQQIHQGDVLAFGGNHFRYVVAIEKEEKAVDARQKKERSEKVANTQFQQNAQPPIDATQTAKTTFISTANSFLDIFCAQNDDEEDADSRSGFEHKDAVEKNTDAPTNAWARFFYKIKVFFKELKGAFKDEDTGGSKKWWITGGLVTLLGAVAVGIYIMGYAERQVTDLLVRGQYKQGVELANDYLCRHPENAKIQTLAIEALTKAMVPPWSDAVRKNDYSGAKSSLSDPIFLSDCSNGQGHVIVDTLKWVGDLEEFMNERGRTGGKIRLFVHEDRIESLLDRWKENKKVYRSALRRMLNDVPEFGDIHTQTFSDLSVLRSDKSSYLSAIRRLKGDVQAALTADRADDIAQIVGRFGRKYPNISGTDSLLNDLGNYQIVQNEIKAQNLLEVVKLVAETPFETELFQAKLEEIKKTALPPDTIVSRYNQAAEDWRAGNTQSAIEILTELQQTAWGEAAAQDMERKRKIIKDFDGLRKAEKKPDYQERLLSFYGLLDPEEDMYFVKIVEKDFTLQKSQAVAVAQKAMDRAKLQWSQYREKGGIRGLYRLEATISSTFEQQAKHLSEAYDNVQKGAKIYQLLKQEIESDQKDLQTEIIAETKLQRRSLRELSMVLKPSLLKSKLDLIAAP